MMAPWRHILPLLALVLSTGCPTYEDEFSGTFRQVVLEETTNAASDERLAVDLFRFGDNAQGVVRYYDFKSPANREEPFSEESRCFWTNTGAFDTTDNSFLLDIPDETLQREQWVQGRLEENGYSLKVRLTGSQGASGDFEFIRVSDDPVDVCNHITPYALTANFDSHTNVRNAFEEGVYELRKPVLIMVWVAVEARETAGGPVYFGTTQNRYEDYAQLDELGKITSDRLGLRESVMKPFRPPLEAWRMFKGQTRVGLGHLVVVDDTENGSPFQWDIGTEPIVAAAVQRGAVASGPPGHNGFGRAILFVEGDLEDLDLDDDPRFVGWETVEPTDQHFYVVDVYFEDDRIVRVEFPSTPTSRLDVMITEDFLNASQNPLPRLLPR